MRIGKAGIAAIVAVVLLVVGFTLYGSERSHQVEAPLAEAPLPTGAGEPAPEPEDAAPDTDTTAPLPAVCPTDPQPIVDPVSFRLVSHQVDLPMISVGTDATGAAGSPPENASHMVAWFDQGPLVGSGVGKAVLTTHSYQFGGAFGNELMRGLLEVGDVIMIVGASGDAACYEYSGTHHLLVEDYDPASDVIYDFIGEPQFALVVCSDYTVTGDTLGRIIFYADLLTGPGGGQSDPGEPGLEAQPA